MREKKLLKKILVSVAWILLAVLLILQVGVTVLYWDYFANSKIAFPVPGLWADFVPQGFEYLEDTDTWLMSGYMSDDGPSRVYIRNAEGKTSFATLHHSDLSAYTGHAGGICVNGQYAYLPGDTGVDVFLLEDILSGKATLQGTIPMGFRVDFCSFVDGYLMVGNFYYADHYDTPSEHKILTPAGDNNPGVITVFCGDEQAEFGVDPNAVAAFSIREKVQGVCVTEENQLILSTSWGLGSSVLYCYDLDTARAGELQTLTGGVPLYYLDSENLVKTITAPPMAEELVWRDGRIYVLNESACNQYFFGKLIRGGYVYSYALD